MDHFAANAETGLKPILAIRHPGGTHLLNEPHGRHGELAVPHPHARPRLFLCAHTRDLGRLAGQNLSNPHPQGESEANRGMRSRRDCWTSAVVLASALIYLVFGIFQGIIPYDEGLAFHKAWEVAHGQVPYRDFWAYYAPGQFYTLAGVFRVFGYTILAARLWDTFGRWWICVLVLLIGRKLGLGRAAYWPFLATLLLLASSGFYGYTIYPALLWSFLAVLFLLQLSSRKPSLYLFLAGVATGAAVVYRHDFGAATFISGALALLILAVDDSVFGSEQRDRVLKALLLYGAGTSVLVVPVALCLLRSVPLLELRKDFLGFAHIQMRFRALPFPPALPSPSFLISSAFLLDSWFLFYAPLTVYLIGWVALARSLRRPAPDPQARDRRFCRNLLTLLGSMLLVPAIIRPELMHCLPANFPAAILLFVLLADFDVAKRSRWARVLVTLSLLVLAVPYVVAPLDWWRLHLQANAPWWVRTSSLPPARYFRVRPDAEEAAWFIRQNVPEDQAIFVGNWQHHPLLCNDEMFYFLVQRRSGTRFDDLVPGVMTTAPVQQEVIRDLERNRVNYIVLVYGYGFDRNPAEVVVDSGVTLLDDFIRSEYEEIHNFGHYSIWKRKSPSTTSER